MKINKKLTTINRTPGPGTDRIKYIVIHYVGATGGAEANCKYYAEQYVGASAHYYVDFNGSIWQSVEDKDVAWHCGTQSGYKHLECRNGNSIGIEMCVRTKGSKAADGKDWVFEQATVDGAIALAKHLMAKYNIPAGRVIRHHDVTGKICPNPYVYNHTSHTWDAFKTAIARPDSGWQTDNIGTWYRHADGSYTKNDWEQIEGKWYWFDGAGYAVHDAWSQGKDGKWYYLGQDCVMVANTVMQISGEVFAFGADGAMITGDVKFKTNARGALIMS